jgi:hypothetical protein
MRMVGSSPLASRLVGALAADAQDLRGFFDGQDRRW